MLMMPCDCTGNVVLQLLWKRLDGQRNEACSIVRFARFIFTAVPNTPVPDRTVKPSLKVTPTVESTLACPTNPSVTRNVPLPPKDHRPALNLRRVGFTSPLTVMFVTVPLAGNTAWLPSVHAQAAPPASCQLSAAVSHTADSAPVQVRSAAPAAHAPIRNAAISRANLRPSPFRYSPVAFAILSFSLPACGLKKITSLVFPLRQIIAKSPSPLEINFPAIRWNVHDGTDML